MCLFIHINIATGTYKTKSTRKPARLTICDLAGGTTPPGGRHEGRALEARGHCFPGGRLQASRCRSAGRPAASAGYAPLLSTSFETLGIELHELATRLRNLALESVTEVLSHHDSII